MALSISNYGPTPQRAIHALTGKNLTQLIAVNFLDCFASYDSQNEIPQVLDSFELEIKTSLFESLITLHPVYAGNLVAVDSVESGKGKKPALSVAARIKSFLTAKVLLDAGANIFLKDMAGHLLIQKPVGDTYVLLKSAMRKDEVVEIKRGRTADSFGSYWACESGNVDAVRQLLKAGGANANAKDSLSMTPLHLATQQGYLTIVKRLLEFGAKVDPKLNGSLGQTPFYFAIKKGHVEVAELLSSYGSNNRCVDMNGGTCAFVASCDGRLDSLKFLTERGIPLDAENPKDANTPLSVAASQVHFKTVQWLLENAADPNTPHGKTPQTALHDAAKDGQFSSIWALLQQPGIHVDALTWEKRIALHFAAESGYYAALLIEHSSSVNISDAINMTPADLVSSSLTPLHWAASKGHKSVVQLFVENGAAIDANSGKQLTPLHYAVLDDHRETGLYLLDPGANMNRLFNDGRFNLLHWAAQEGKFFWAMELVDHGADVEIKNSDGSTPLHLTLKAGHQDLTMYLLGNGKGIETRGYHGFGGGLKIAKVLVEAGADMSILSGDKRDAVDLAHYKQHNEVADYLEDGGFLQQYCQKMNNTSLEPAYELTLKSLSAQVLHTGYDAASLVGDASHADLILQPQTGELVFASSDYLKRNPYFAAVFNDLTSFETNLPTHKLSPPFPSEFRLLLTCIYANSTDYCLSRISPGNFSPLLANAEFFQDEIVLQACVLWFTTNWTRVVHEPTFSCAVLKQEILERIVGGIQSNDGKLQVLASWANEVEGTDDSLASLREFSLSSVDLKNVDLSVWMYALGNWMNGVQAVVSRPIREEVFLLAKAACQVTLQCRKCKKILPVGAFVDQNARCFVGVGASYKQIVTGCKQTSGSAGHERLHRE
ncbi:UNVERIFIED_CONTAM: hypothetical protein HDU68_008964 [Siphonaria sp. JEL0065]|nr:hypothetical protein HDU68_008964 [Siphonaria sp. JEL0065]